MNGVEDVSEKKILFTESKTDQYFSWNWRKSAPTPENSWLRFFSWLRKLFPPVTSVSVCALYGTHFKAWSQRPCKLGVSWLWRHWGEDLAACQPTSFRQSKRFFQTWQNDINNCQYLGKYWSVLNSVKSIFFSETCSMRFMGDEFLPNYPFNNPWSCIWNRNLARDQGL